MTSHIYNLLLTKPSAQSLEFPNMIFASDYSDPGFSWSQLWYEKMEIETALDAVYRLIDSQEKSFETVKERFNQKLETDSFYQSLDEESKSSYFSQFCEREDQTINEIKRLQRNALVMTIFAFFEGKLKNICETIENENILSQKLENVKGDNNIQKLSKFLTDVYKIDKTTAEPSLNLIEDQRFAKNRIVHHEGYLSKDRKERLNLVNGFEVKDFPINSQIEISDPAYLRYLVKHVSEFFSQFLPVIDNRYKEINSCQ